MIRSNRRLPTSSRPRLRLLLWALIAPLLSIPLCRDAAAAPAEAPAGPIGLIIVTPPGVDLGKDAARYIDELTRLVAGAMALPTEALQGQAFSDARAASDRLKVMPDSFALGSLAFFAANRDALNLVPLLGIRSASGEPERFHVVVKRGRFASIEALKGRELHGSPLFEDARFIDEAVFGGRVEASRFFVLKPTRRPLSVLRRLDSEKVDAVLLDGAQFASLKALPLFEKLAEIHVSEPLPSLGLMARDSERTRALRPKLIEAVKRLCSQASGKDLCQSFGIAGFEPADEAAIQALTARVLRRTAP